MALSWLFAASQAAASEGSEDVVEFRCDSMEISRPPTTSSNARQSNQTTCIGNVVVRRAELTLCCQRLVADADSKWQWKRFKCLGDARATSASERFWAKGMRYDMLTEELVLTGKPLVNQGGSYIRGSEIKVTVGGESAQIKDPVGVLEATALSSGDSSASSTRTQNRKTPVSLTTGPLPDTCPLPGRPSF